MHTMGLQSQSDFTSKATNKNTMKATKNTIVFTLLPVSWD